MGTLLRGNGSANGLAARRVSTTVIRRSFSVRRLSGLCRAVRDVGVRVVSSFNSIRLSGLGFSARLPGDRSTTTTTDTSARGLTVSSPIGICLGRVKHIPLLATRRRRILTVHVTSKSRRTGRHLTRTGLHLMIDVTGHCINENVRFLSLVRRNGLNLVGTISGFSCAGNFGFSACTA